MSMLQKIIQRDIGEKYMSYAGGKGGAGVYP
jgi:hypothetical protein